MLSSKFVKISEEMFDLFLSISNTELDPLLVRLGGLNIQIEDLLANIEAHFNPRQLKFRLEGVARMLNQLTEQLKNLGQYLVYVQCNAVNVDFI